MLQRLRPSFEGRHGDERVRQNSQESQKLRPYVRSFSVQILLEMRVLRVLRDYNDVLQAQEHD